MGWAARACFGVCRRLHTEQLTRRAASTGGLRRSLLFPPAARLGSTTQALRPTAATVTQLWAVLRDGAQQARPVESGASLWPGDGAGSSGTSRKSRSSLWRGSVRSAYLWDGTTSTAWFASSTASTRPHNHSPNSLHPAGNVERGIRRNPLPHRRAPAAQDW